MDWYYSDGEVQRGPVDDAGLQAAYDSGMVTPSTPVWREGMDDWLPFSQVVNLSGATAEIPAAPAAKAAEPAAPAKKPAGKSSSGRKSMKMKKKRRSPGASSSTRISAPAKGGQVATGAARAPSPARAANLQQSTGQAGPLAGRGTRLMAIFIDGSTAILVYIPLIILLVSRSKGAMIAAMSLSALVGLGLFIMQLRYISKYSATIGKKVMNIYIADLQGQPASMGKIIGMRYIVNALLGMIPGYVLVDILLIFRGDRRCAHDLIAGTQVLTRVDS